MRIASKLAVARSTLFECSRQLCFQLQDQAAIEFDRRRDRLLNSLDLLRIIGPVTRTGFRTGNRPIFPWFNGATQNR